MMYFPYDLIVIMCEYLNEAEDRRNLHLISEYFYDKYKILECKACNTNSLDKWDDQCELCDNYYHKCCRPYPWVNKDNSKFDTCGDKSCDVCQVANELYYRNFIHHCKNKSFRLIKILDLICYQCKTKCCNFCKERNDVLLKCDMCGLRFCEMCNRKLVAKYCSFCAGDNCME